MTNSRGAFYRILGVSQDASTNDIRRAYQDLVQEYHPDVSDDPNPELISGAKTARDVLVDEDERGRYDRMGHQKYVKLEVEGSLPDIFDEYREHPHPEDQHRSVTAAASEAPAPPPGPRQGSDREQQARPNGSSTATRSTGQSWSTAGTDSTRSRASQTDARRRGESGTLYPDSGSVRKNSGAAIKDRFDRIWLTRAFFVIAVLFITYLSSGLFDLPPDIRLFSALVVTACACVGLAGIRGYRQMRQLYLGSDDQDALSGRSVFYGPILISICLLLTGIGMVSGGGHPWGYSLDLFLSLVGVAPGSPWVGLFEGSQQFNQVFNYTLSSILLCGVVVGIPFTILSLSGRAWHQRFIVGDDINIVVWDALGMVIAVFLGVGLGGGYETFPFVPEIQTSLLPGDGITFLGVALLSTVFVLLVWIVQTAMLR